MVSFEAWVTGAAGVATVTLAVAAFLQLRDTRLERRAAFAKSLLDDLYGPLYPFRRKWRDKYWIYKGIDLKHWDHVRTYKPHLMVSMPENLVEALDQLAEARRDVHGPRSAVASALQKALNEWATTHGLCESGDIARLSIVPRYKETGQAPAIDLVEAWALGESPLQFAARIASDRGHQVVGLEIHRQGVPIESPHLLDDLLEHVQKTMDSHTGGPRLRMRLAEGAEAGRRAAEALEKEVERLTSMLAKAGTWTSA